LYQYSEKTTDLQQVTDKLYHVILSTALYQYSEKTTDLQQVTDKLYHVKSY
jgi:ribosomal protein L30E